MKQKIIIVLGSNYEQEKNVRYAIMELTLAFPEIAFSRMIRTEPIGMADSPQFVNAIGIAMTEKKEEHVVRILKGIERKCGRTKEDKALGIVKLDLDLLLYGDVRHKESDWKRNYVKLLMSEMDSCSLSVNRSLP